MATTNGNGGNTPWHGWSWSTSGWPGFPRFDTPAPVTQPQAATVERYDIVTVRYRCARCGGDVRELTVDHSDALPRGTEPRRYASDVTGEGPLTFTQVCAVAERLVVALPVQNDAL